MSTSVAAPGGIDEAHVQSHSGKLSPDVNVAAGLFFRASLIYVALWTVSWITLFIDWPAPLDRAVPLRPLQTFYQWLSIDFLGLDRYYIPHVGFAFLLILAALGAVSWLLMDRERRLEIQIAHASQIMTRYVLAAGMLVYGIPTLVPLYARQPDAVDLATIYGEFAARDVMDLAIGYGPVYQGYIGLQHVVAGVCLLIPRAVPFGALLALMTMGHASMLFTGFNHGGTRLEYGAATLAGHFTVMALILILPDWRRVVDIFLLNRRAVKSDLLRARPDLGLSPSASHRLRIAAIAAIILPPVVRDVLVLRDVRAKSPLNGVYAVESMVRNGVSLPLTYETPGRWQFVAIGNYADRAMIRLTDGTRLDFRIGEPDTSSSTWRRAQTEAHPDSGGSMALTPTPAGSISTLHYQRPAPDRLELNGIFAGDTVRAVLRRQADSTFRIRHRWWW
jgi:hypothetical protein